MLPAGDSGAVTLLLFLVGLSVSGWNLWSEEWGSICNQFSLFCFFQHLHLERVVGGKAHRISNSVRVGCWVETGRKWAGGERDRTRQCVLSSQNLRSICNFSQAGSQVSTDEHTWCCRAHFCFNVWAPASLACAKGRNHLRLACVVVYLFKSLLFLQSSKVPCLWFALVNAC